MGDFQAMVYVLVGSIAVAMAVEALKALVWAGIFFLFLKRFYKANR